MRTTLLLATVALAACATSQPTRSASPASTRSAVAGPPQFIEDDYPAALAQARAQDKPLFVDAWAPW